MKSGSQAHFSNTTERWRRVEDLKDLLASIEDNGEIRVGEHADTMRLLKLAKAALALENR